MLIELELGSDVTIIVRKPGVYAFSIILFVLEFIVRRIAEYPKGPILAASVLVGGIFVFVKAMT